MVCHNRAVARGWESKSVESQMESAESERAERAEPQLTPEQLARRRERESLELSRTRVLHDLESAQNPRYRRQLEAALAHLEEKIKAVK